MLIRSVPFRVSCQVSYEQLARTVDHHLEPTSRGSTMRGVESACALPRYQPEEAWRVPRYMFEVPPIA
jgi:hypothetical protein